MDKISVLVKEPDKAPYLDWCDSHKKQTAWLLGKLGGEFIVVSLTERIFIFFRDEYLALKPNFFVPEFEDVIFGTAVFLGVDEEGNTVNLTDKQIDSIMSYFQWKF